jgi:VWFA-related protein
MVRGHLFKNIILVLLTMLLALGWVTGTLAQDLHVQTEEGEDGLVVIITRVDSQDFPQVTAYATVLDRDGWPIGILTAADFWVIEDETPVSTTSITVERDDTQNIGLVLALDTSTSSETFEQIREAAESFVDILGPHDRVAIVAFNDEVQVVQSFTNDKGELQAAIALLEPRGSYTALNEAAVEAATMASTLPPGRRAVIMLTDSANNVGTLSTADAINKALEAEAPLYILGLEPDVEPQVLDDMTRLTGGLPLILSYPSEMKENLHAVERLLRQGYRITIQSGIEADSTLHELSIGVAYAGAEAETYEHFVAVPGEVTVTLPDIADGQTVGGMVSLVAEITTPAPIASVEYLLDDQLLTKQFAPTTAIGEPYVFLWDSTTVEPGDYTLTVKVVDNVGNEGQAQVGLNVVLPLVVTLSTAQQEIELGNEVTVEAQVDALAEVSRVEFLLDDRALGSANTPPYHFSFDNSDYPAGEHVVTVCVEDSLGREERASLRVQFLPSAEPQPESQPERGWLSTIKAAAVTIANIVIVIAAFIVAVFIAVNIFRAASEWQRREYQTVRRLEIQNLGNVRNCYQLLAEEPSGALVFQFALDGVSLHQRQTTQVAERGGEPGPDRRELTRVQRAGRPTPSGSLTGLEKARQKTDRAKGMSQAIASTLNTLGVLLPGSMGAPLRSWASRLRQQQAAVTRIEQAPSRTSGGLQRIRRQVSQVKPPASPGRATVSSPPQRMDKRQVRSVARTIVDAWARTPFVEPGETLAVDLLIDPIKRSSQTEQYPITVTSKSVEKENAPPVIEEGIVQIMGVSWFRHLLPSLIFVAVIVIEALLIWLLLSSMGVLG